jgi:hypothetical protein
MAYGKAANWLLSVFLVVILGVETDMTLYHLPIQKFPKIHRKSLKKKRNN